MGPLNYQAVPLNCLVVLPLEAVKKRRIAKKASLVSKIIVGIGEGRATKECELMWSPIFETSTNGILTVRIYVGKVYL